MSFCEDLLFSSFLSPRREGEGTGKANQRAPRCCCGKKNSGFLFLGVRSPLYSPFYVCTSVYVALKRQTQKNCSLLLLWTVANNVSALYKGQAPHTSQRCVGHLATKNSGFLPHYQLPVDNILPFPVFCIKLPPTPNSQQTLDTNTHQLTHHPRSPRECTRLKTRRYDGSTL